MTTTTTLAPPPLKLDDLVGKYIKLREKKVQLKAAYEASLAPYDELQNKIEALLLAKFAAMGVDSVKTPGGTAYTAVRTSASLGDWDSFRAFCEQQEDPFQYLDRRVSKAAVEHFRDTNDDLPPGVNWSETRVVNFRKS